MSIPAELQTEGSLGPGALIIVEMIDEGDDSDT